jgi:hypothetical protein
VGTGTHIGEFSSTQQTNGATFNGSAHWVAANGDSIDSTFVPSVDFSTASLGYITVTETHTVTGGTGRFTGAQGALSWSARILSHPVPMERTSPSARSMGALLPRAQITEEG